MKKLIKSILNTVLFLTLGVNSTFCQQTRTEIISERLDSLIAQAFALDATPGLAVAVVRGNELIYAKGFGYADLEARRPVTPQTMFYVASTTKSFTACAAALLHEREELDLDKPLSRYLPDLKLQSPLSADDINLRDLLTHTHGIDNEGPVVFRTAFSGVYTHDQLVELLKFHKPASTGRAFNYGNIGYNVASLAMDATLNIGWKELLQREIFNPLGMKSTTAYRSQANPERLAMPYVIEENGYRRLPYAKSDNNMHAAGGHLSTALDLAKWLLAHINSGRADGKQIFPEKVVAETHRKQADQNTDFANFHRYGWGLGWDLGIYQGDTLIHRFGSFSGFRSHVSFMPQHKIGVVVLVNESSLGSFLTDLVATSLYDCLLEKPGFQEKYDTALENFRSKATEVKAHISQDKAKRALRPQSLPYPLSTYAGKYENAAFGQMEWKLVGGKLEVEMGLLSSPVEVYDGEQNKFRVELTGGGEVITFSIQDGRAENLTYKGWQFNRVKP